MKRRWECAMEICANGNGIGPEKTVPEETASTSADCERTIGPTPTKQKKEHQKRQKFSSIEHLLREEKKRKNGDGGGEEKAQGRGGEGEMKRKRSGTMAKGEEKEEGEGREGMGPKRRKREEKEEEEEEEEGQSELREGKDRTEETKRTEEKEEREKEEEEGHNDSDGEEEEAGEGPGEEEEKLLLRSGNWLNAVTVPDSGSAADGLNCELENADTWAQFNQLGTEMIITKSGRRMFPVLRLRFSGTRPGHLYFVFMDVVPVERRHRFRYRYDKSQWQSAGKADKQPFGRLFLHNESPFSGEQLPLQLVTFDKAKLTNNEKSNPDPDQLLLNSMHKYRPRVHVLCVAPSAVHSAQTPTFPKQFRRAADFEKLRRFPYKTFEFAETKFVAVTAYQNQLVTRKKIELNPFAKGFRDQKGDEEEENGDKSFLAEIATADEWKTKRKGTEDKGDEKNFVRCPTVLLKPYRSPPAAPPVQCHQPTPIRPLIPPPFAFHAAPFWPPLLPPHLLSGLLLRIGTNQRQMREQANSGERQTEKGDE